MNPFKLILNNLRSDNVYVLLTANSTKNLQGITAGVPTSITAITNNIITADLVDSGRLYFIKGMPTNNPPTPNGPDYYGWIEFSKMPTDCTGNNCQLWINLSNVDIFGMPLSISGIDTTGQNFSEGYKSGATDTVRYLSHLFPSAVVPTNGLSKIVAPNIMPSAYPKFDTYLKHLTSTNAKMTITSDVANDGTFQTFKGNFCHYLDTGISETVLVKLVDAKGNTFKITENSLNTDIIYKCDGGHIYYNNIKHAQNRSGSSDNVIVTNSVFREIMLGLNEGYFVPNGRVTSCDFPSYIPFAHGGNMYAKVIHGLSNSYGFPYADSNLKVLITAQASTGTPVTVTICDDIHPYGFTDKSKSTTNAPICGLYHFGIGTGSNVGDVEVGSCRYNVQPGGTYGDYLPSCPDWTKMSFSGASKWIWMSTSSGGTVVSSDDNGVPCFIGAAPIWVSLPTGGMCLTWGADTTLNPAAGNPSKPTS